MKTLKKMRAAAWVSAVVMGLVLPAGVQAQHKCAQGGQVTYQQTPCPSTGPARSLERDRAEAERRQRESRPVATPPAVAPAPSSLPTASSRWRCDGRRHCSQMTSCEEAKFFLANCPGVKMDGDHDGVPCEEQWCRSGG